MRLASYCAWSKNSFQKFKQKQEYYNGMKPIGYLEIFFRRVANPTTWIQISLRLLDKGGIGPKKQRSKKKYLFQKREHLLF